MARRSAAKEAANDTGRMELKTVVDNRTIGEVLREARIARDEDYGQVCEQLRIRRAYMEAIEDGRFGDLPGSAYAIGFVRTYAEYLGLDVAKTVAKYKQEAADFEENTRLVFPEPMPASRGPTVSIIIVALILLVGAYAGWLYVSNQGRDRIELVPPLPKALQDLLSQSAAPANDVSQLPAAVPEQAASTDQAESNIQAVPLQETTNGVVVEPKVDLSPTSTSAENVSPVIVNETIASATENADANTVVDPATTAVETTEADPVEAAVEAIVEEATQESQEIAAEVAATATEPELSVVETAVEETVAAEKTVIAEQSAVTEQPADQTAVAQTEEIAAVTQESETVPVIESSVTEPTVQESLTDTAVVTEEPSFSVPVPATVEPTTYGEATPTSRVLIRSKSAAWVEITEPDGNVLLTRLLRPGDTFNVPDRPGITLVTGNAGGLEFVVDGQVAPPIGEIGDVRRDVVLEPEILLTGVGQQNG